MDTFVEMGDARMVFIAGKVSEGSCRNRARMNDDKSARFPGPKYAGPPPSERLSVPSLGTRPLLPNYFLVFFFFSPTHSALYSDRRVDV